MGPFLVASVQALRSKHFAKWKTLSLIIVRDKEYVCKIWQGPLPCLSTLVDIGTTQVIKSTKPFLFTFVHIFFGLKLTFDLYLQLSEGREEASSVSFHSSILLADTKLESKPVQLGEGEKREGGEGKEERGKRRGEKEEGKEESRWRWVREREEEEEERWGEGGVMTELLSTTCSVLQLTVASCFT